MLDRFITEYVECASRATAHLPFYLFPVAAVLLVAALFALALTGVA